MWIILKYFFILTILCLQPSLYSMDYVYQNVNGNLSNSWSLRLTLFTNNLKGIILYCFDSDKNQFGMEVTRGGHNEKFIRITYNDVYKLIPLKTLNICMSCYVTMMTCDIQFHDGMFRVKSNYFDSEAFPIDGLKSTRKDTDNNIYYTPLRLKNIENTLYIMVGNIGPYTSEFGTEVFASKEQMVGCVDKMYFNELHINLYQNGAQFIQPVCPLACNVNICNDGVCQIQSNLSIICNCSSTALNGQYCNRSLISYSSDSKNSYKSVKDNYNVHSKMTWLYASEKVYCLMDISYKKRHVTIYIDKSHLMMDSIIVSYIKSELNFMTVVMSNNYLTVTTKHNNSRMYFPFAEEVTIDVGFSRSNNKCETFYGKYDIHFNSPRLRPIPHFDVVETSEHEYATSTEVTTKKNYAGENDFTKTLVIVLSSGAVLVIIFVIIGVVNFTMTLKIRNKVVDRKSIEMKQTEQKVDHPPDSSNSTYAEVDHKKEYIVHMDNTMDIDGYILPSKKEVIDMPPKLPPRSVDNT